MQKNWIGKGEGVEVDFPIEGLGEKLRIFTTRPDTLFGVTFMCIAPEHPLSEKLIQDKSALDAVKAKYGKETEKVGLLTQFHATNPLNGDKVPVYIANFVLMEYGTGAIMSVPAHDQRDFEFAQKYGLPVKVVIVPDSDHGKPKSEPAEAFEDEGILVDSGQFTGAKSDAAKKEIIQLYRREGTRQESSKLQAEGLGHFAAAILGHAHPRDLLRRCGTVPVPEEDLARDTSLRYESYGKRRFSAE